MSSVSMAGELDRKGVEKGLGALDVSAKESIDGRCRREDDGGVRHGEGAPRAGTRCDLTMS